MKHLTKLLRLLPALLALSLILSAAALPALAADSDSSRDMTEWEYAPLTDTLTASYPARRDQPSATVSYHTHELEGTPAWSRLFVERRETHYRYEENAVFGDIRCSFSAPGFASDVVFMYANNDDSFVPYFTDASAARITALLEGDTSGGHLLRIPADRYSVSSQTLPDTWAALLDGLEASRTEGASSTRTDTLKDLRFLTPIVVYTAGDPSWFSVPTHFIFEMGDGTYVLPADTLSDACFQNGSLNTTLSDTVTLYRLTPATLTDLQSLQSAAEFDRTNTVYEYSDLHPSDPFDIDDISDTNIAYVAVVFCGMLVPVAPITVGLVKGCRNRKPHNTRWFWLAIAGGAWFVTGILLIVVIAV